MENVKNDNVVALRVKDAEESDARCSEEKKKVWMLMQADLTFNLNHYTTMNR